MTRQCDAAAYLEWVGVPYGRHCSSDIVTVWHGHDTPAVSCGFHARFHPLETFRGARLRRTGTAPDLVECWSGETVTYSHGRPAVTDPTLGRAS